MPRIRKPTFKGSVKRSPTTNYWVTRHVSQYRHNRITLTDLLQDLHAYALSSAGHYHHTQPAPTCAQLLADLLYELNHSQWYNVPILISIRDQVLAEQWDEAAHAIQKGLTP